MGQRLKKAALMFGQVEQQPRPTLSDFYRGVGESQAGAVQDITKGVQTKTGELAGKMGVQYGAEGGAELKASPFKSMVQETKGPTGQAVVTPTGAQYTATGAVSAGPATETDYLQKLEEATKTAAEAKKKAEELEAAQKEKTGAAETAGETLLKTGKEEFEKSQKALTEGKLGERREASELEKAAQDYRNILTTTPATSNIAAVSNLMRFYDPKYATLESGLRQGEISLARQQAGATETGMRQAEAERAGAVGMFGKTAEQAYSDLKQKTQEEKQKTLEAIKAYYEPKIKAEGETARVAANKKQEIEQAKEGFEQKEMINAADNIKKNPAVNVTNIINAISGRSANNWLNVRGNEVLRPIQQKIDELVNNAVAIQSDATKPYTDRKAAIEKINNEISEYRDKIAGELAAFLGDTNTQPGDALDAAEQIMANGLVDSLSNDQKRMIRDRIRADRHVEMKDRNKISSPEKLQRIYQAFGGTEDLSPNVYAV